MACAATLWQMWRQAVRGPRRLATCLNVRVELMQSRLAIAAGVAVLLLAGPPGSGAAQAQPHTLQDALSAAYANNPTLQGARALLRATD
jgi:hypothetical protein